jgi:Arc/MetJ-type ribon-helix-helix transcriptional regulator
MCGLSFHPGHAKTACPGARVWGNGRVAFSFPVHTISKNAERRKHGRIEQGIFLARRDRRRGPLRVRFGTVSKEVRLPFVEERPMTIDLKPEQLRVIDLAVRSGAYENANEVLDHAFEIIREQLDLEDWMLGQLEEVAAHIAVGFAQAERGDLVAGDAVAEILRQRRSKRLKPLG